MLSMRCRPGQASRPACGTSCSLVNSRVRGSGCLKAGGRVISDVGGASQPAEDEDAQWWYCRGVDAHLDRAPSVRHLADIISSTSRRFDEGNVATALTVAARLPRDPSTPSLTSDLLHLSHPILPTFHAKSVASVVQALHKMSHNDDVYFRKISDLVIAKQYAGVFTAKQLVVTAQAFSAWGASENEARQVSVARQVIASLMDTANPTLSRSWSAELETVSHGEPGGPEFIMDNFDAADAGTMLTAMADVEVYDPQFVSALAKRLVAQGGEKLWPAQFSVLANICIALGRLRHRDPDLMDCVLERLPSLEAPPTSPTEIAGLVRAFVVLDCWQGAGWILRGLGSEQWVLSVRRFCASEIGSLAWSHSIMKEHQPWVLELGVRAQRVGIKLSNEDKANIYRYINMLEAAEQLPSIARSADFKELREECEVAFKEVREALAGAVPAEGSMHQAVAETCRSLGLGEVYVNALVEDVADPVDVALKMGDGTDVGIYVACPQMLTQSLPHVPVGGLVGAMAALQDKDWRVVVVPVSEWVLIPASLEARQDYMRKLIEDARSCAPECKW